jgi:tetratricopeptide (TPR) repeat protein
LSEEDFRTAVDRALRLRDAGDHSTALDILMKLLEEGPRRAGVVALIGQILYYEMRDPVQALPFLRESVELSPDSERSSLALCHALFAVDAGDEAFHEMRRFLSGHESEEYSRLLADMNRDT